MASAKGRPSAGEQGIRLRPTVKKRFYEAAMRQNVMPKLSETRWTSRVDTLSGLLVHYKSLLSVPETVQSNFKGLVAADASSYHAVLLKFDIHRCSSCIKPLSILLQSESCDLVKTHQET